jgi:hypothetical protein
MIAHPTTTQTESRQQAQGPDLALHPADILLNLIAAILAPMFLTATNGDINIARIAAIETIRTYSPRNNADLIAIAQIVACGLAALGSLSLSMADDISLSMTIRLRGNANALMRSAETHRRALGTTETAPPTDPGPDPYEAEVIDSLAQTAQRVAETQTRPQTPTPSPEPTPTPTPPTSTQQANQAIWAAAMTQVASEFAADLPHLPQAERKMATLRAAALSSCANNLLSGAIPPTLKPGALNALIRPNAR